MNERIRRMGAPVRCLHCGAIYDLQAVTVVARYADCSMFKTPCCGTSADDRTWKSMPDFEKLERNGHLPRFTNDGCPIHYPVIE